MTATTELRIEGLVKTISTIRAELKRGNYEVEGFKDAMTLYTNYLNRVVDEDHFRAAIAEFERMSESRYLEVRGYAQNAIATLDALVNL